MRAATNEKKAFTLVELLVVLVVIALTTAIVIPFLAYSRQKARSSNCRSNLKSIGLAIGMYQTDYNNKLPHPSNAAMPPHDPNAWGALAERGGESSDYNPFHVLAHFDYLTIGWADNTTRVRNSVLTCPSDIHARKPLPPELSTDDAACHNAHTYAGLTQSYGYNFEAFNNISPSSYEDVQHPAKMMLVMDLDSYMDGQTAIHRSDPQSTLPLDGQDNLRAALYRHGGKGSNVLYADLHVAYTPAFAWHPTRAFNCRSHVNGDYLPVDHDAMLFYGESQPTGP